MNFANKTAGKGGILRDVPPQAMTAGGYSIRADLNEDVLMDIPDSRSGLAEDDITDGEMTDGNNQVETT